MSAGVVADASVVIALHQLHHLELLRDRYPTIAIPSAVNREVSGARTPPVWLTVIDATVPFPNHSWTHDSIRAKLA